MKRFVKYLLEAEVLISNSISTSKLTNINYRGSFKVCHIHYACNVILTFAELLSQEYSKQTSWQLHVHFSNVLSVGQIFY